MYVLYVCMYVCIVCILYMHVFSVVHLFDRFLIRTIILIEIILTAEAKSEMTFCVTLCCRLQQAQIQKWVKFHGWL